MKFARFVPFAACALLGSLPVAVAAGADGLSAADESQLGRGATVDTILRIALERNQELLESRARTAAAEARRLAADRLPDLEAKYEQWGVPLGRPYALGRADTLMLGVRQSFPAWGVLEARGRAAAEDTGRASDAARMRQLELTAQVRRTFAAYFRADRELKLHREHVALTGRFLELARLGQRTGHGRLQDILGLQLEQTRLHTDIARLEREYRASRAMLNALMDRAPDAPLGSPEELAPGAPARAAVADLEQNLDSSRPELTAAARAVRRGEATLDELHRAARLPSLMVGLDYWYMPMNPDTHHGYGAMLSINLPWLSGRRRDEEREAEAMVRAERHAFLSTRNALRAQLRDAAAGVEAARQTFVLVDQELLAQARRNLEVAEAEYSTGQGDAGAPVEALRAYLQVRIERLRALAELSTSEAELERAAGIVNREGGHQ